MVNIALVLVLTTLQQINQSLRMMTLQSGQTCGGSNEHGRLP
jgi:hypothetical protein